MRNKIILALVTFGMAAAAYFVLSSGDRRTRPQTDRETSDAVRDFVSLPTTQQSHSITDAELTFRPGDHTLARVYDDVSGRLKYQFEAKKWEPISETQFHVEQLLIQIHTPRGEITYISADTAEVTIARRSRKRIEPRRGWLKDNVKIIIDRTTSKWRQAHPERADLYAHPEDLTHIDLEDATFDLEQAELVSKGSIVVDSAEARIENVRGLTLQWNELDNRIDVLRFEHGGRMLLRRGGKMVDFAMPGTMRDAQSGDQPEDAAGPSTAARTARFEVPRAQAMKPMSIEAVTADEAAAQIRLEGGVAVANRPKSLDEEIARGPGSLQSQDPLRSPEALAKAMETLKAEARAGTAGEMGRPDALDLIETQGRKRIHTYRAVFHNHVVVEQQEGLRTIGKLCADKLEINFDFGEKLRGMTRSRRRERSEPTPGGPTTRPADASPLPEGPASPIPLEQDRTKLILTWDGPLEMRPLRVDPSEQTGQRFDAIATGEPVTVESEEGQAARCNQLVYRHERRQVWLSGSEARPVEISVGASRRLVGREVFFDQVRGLARVDGPGSMMGERGAEATEAKTTGADLSGRTAELIPSARSKTERRRRDPVEIRWTGGVDIELGHRTIKQKNASTGLMEDKRREYLQRAWFHGDVSVRQGESRLSAGKVAATFGIPLSGDALADHIQHLNTSGNVRIVREGDLIAADRLDMEMTVRWEHGRIRNDPKIVDAYGNVLVRRGESEFRAQQMHAVLAPLQRGAKTTVNGGAPTIGRTRMGIKSLDASGDVFVSDPNHNLKIRKAETLACTMRNGNELVQVTIVGADPERFARARYGEVEIHGHHIAIDMDKESVDVPGPGKAWVRTQKDFSGRKLGKPTFAKIGWQDNMQFRLARDYAVFSGKVRSKTLPPGDGPRRGAQLMMLDIAAMCSVATAYFVNSPGWKPLFHMALKYRHYGRLKEDLDTEWRSFALDCDRLTIRFERVAPTRRQQQSKKSLYDRFSLVRSILAGDSSGKVSEVRVLPREEKRPANVVAEGHAEALSISRESRSPTGKLGRLLTRVLIKGDRIVADLAREQMSVPCSGDLVIEDYQFDREAGRRRASRTAFKRGPLMSTMENDGPSQTAIGWGNSMDFFVDRNWIAFDKDVSMVHRSGQEMVLQEDLAEAMRVDTRALRRLDTGRRASLSCGYLLIEFMVDDESDAESDATTPVIRATDLKRLIAKHAVHLQEGTRSLMGAYLHYLRETDEVRLEGSAALEARIIDQDEAEQRFNIWRGPLLIWNRRTNEIESPGATVRASRR